MANGTPCSVDGCDRPSACKGMCPMHYQRSRKGIPLDAPVRKRTGIKHCTVNDCGRPVVAQAMCGMHYRRWNKYGDPLGGGPFQPLSDPTRCQLDGCDRAHYGHGFCNPHYVRFRDHGDPLGGRGSVLLGIDPKSVQCEADGCGQDAKSDGLCWSHLNRKRYADPDYRENWTRWSHDRRARLVDAFVESFNRTEIFERDAWRCALCGLRIDGRLEHPDPMSPTIDHIVPLSKGGEHSRANAQSAHLRCNLSKNNRAANDQLRLIG